MKFYSTFLHSARPGHPDGRRCGSEVEAVTAKNIGETDSSDFLNFSVFLLKWISRLANGTCERAPNLGMFLPTIFLVAWISLTPKPSSAQDNTFRYLSEGELKSKISLLKEIKIHPGQNDEYFAGIDQQGDITADYMDFGTTGSHNLFIVTTDDDDLRSIIIPIGENQDEFVEDAPFDGEMVQKSVRFFNGLLQGSPATILYISTLDGSASSNSNGARATISVQLLLSTEDDFPPFQFKEICKFTTSETYFNANQALKSTLNIPLP